MPSEQIFQRNNNWVSLIECVQHASQRCMRAMRVNVRRMRVNVRRMRAIHASHASHIK